MFFGQLVIAGLLTGSVYSMIGVGFTLVLGVGKIANFAHGSFVGVGLYFALFMWQKAGLNPYEALVPGLLAFILIGWAVAELFEWRGRKIGEIGELLVGLALLLTIGGLLEVLYTDNPRSFEAPSLGGVSVFGATVPWTEIIAAIFTLALAAATYFFVRLSRWGRAMRAVAENATAAGLYGVRAPITQRAAVTASIAIAGVSGMFIAPFTVMTPDAGTSYLISAFAVVIIGGIGRTMGAVAAGLAIGVVEALTGGYLSSVWTTLAPLLVILGFLLVRPEAGVAK
jgi:branched-chain amino acid transport system permease protein